MLFYRRPIQSDLPVYMQGMSSFDVRSLSSTYTPSNGNETMYEAQPGEWQTTGQTGGADNVFRAWSGGKGDADNLKLYVHGGGHSDSSNNGIHVYDLSGSAAPVGWTVQTGSQSALSAVTESTEFYSDGRPTAIHSYDGLWFDSNQNRLYRCGGSGFGPGGGGIDFCAYFDFDTNTWTTLANNSVLGTSLGSTLIGSPDGTKLLYLSSTNTPQFIDTSSGSLTGYGSTPWGSEEKNPVMLYDTLRAQYVCFDSFTSARALVFTVTWASNTWSSASNALSGANASDLNSGGAACLYDAARDLYWVFGNDAACSSGSIAYIYSVNPTTWAVTRYTLGTAITTNVANNGMYNRFVWLPLQRMVATVAEYNQAAQLIKIPLS